MEPNPNERILAPGELPTFKIKRVGEIINTAEIASVFDIAPKTSYADSVIEKSEMQIEEAKRGKKEEAKLLEEKRELEAKIERTFSKTKNAAARERLKKTREGYQKRLDAINELLTGIKVSKGEKI